MSHGRPKLKESRRDISSSSTDGRGKKVEAKRSGNAARNFKIAEGKKKED